MAVFAVGAATPPVAFAIDRLVVTGPVIMKVSKSKRIWKINDSMSIEIYDSVKTSLYTDGSRILHTLLVKHFNTLLDRLSSEQGKDEVTYFYVGDVFCIHYTPWD